MKIYIFWLVNNMGFIKLINVNDIDGNERPDILIPDQFIILIKMYDDKYCIETELLGLKYLSCKEMKSYETLDEYIKDHPPKPLKKTKEEWDKTIFN